MLRIFIAATAIASGFLLAPVAHAQDRWHTQPGASELTFALSIGGVPAAGRFGTWAAEITFDPAAPETGQVTVRIDIASAWIDSAQAQSGLLSAAWLDPAGHPEAVFKGEGFTIDDDGAFTLPGSLTLKGVEAPLTLAGHIQIDGNTAWARIETRIARETFGVGPPDPAISPQITVSAQLRAERQAP